MPPDLQSNIIAGALGLAVGLIGGIYMRPKIELGQLTRGEVLRAAVGLLILGLVIAGYVGQTAANQRLNSLATCEHQTFTQFAEGLQQRGMATQQANMAAKTNAAALEQFVSQVAQGARGPALTGDLETLQRALAGYEHALDDLNTAQTTHPLELQDCAP